MKKKPSRYSPLLLLFFLGLIWLTFNKSGLIKWYMLKREHNYLIEEISTLQNNEILLVDHIDRLSNDFEYIEFLAYSKFKMVKPGEKIFKIKDYKDLNK